MKKDKISIKLKNLIIATKNAMPLKNKLSFNFKSSILSAEFSEEIVDLVMAGLTTFLVSSKST